MPEPAHVPVMVQQVADWLVIRPEGTYWDATVGAAGHTRVILERLAEGGRMFGSDRDARSLELASTALTGAPVTLVPARFTELEDAWQRLGAGPIDGILFDFGVGSFQLDDGERGISFEIDGPLDMRMGRSDETAGDRLNRVSEQDLVDVLRTFGEERHARAIARSIIGKRPVESTSQLRDAIASVANPRYLNKTLARVFQAIRIWVNEELDEIRAGLAATQKFLAPGGRIVTIAYHSLEDRIAKQFFRDASADCLCPDGIPMCVCDHSAWLRTLTRKPMVPDAAEVAHNRRARSAKMRVAERL